GSVLSAYRAVLALRKRHPALVSGSIRFLDTEGDVLAFVREGEGERLVCIFNFADEQVNWALPGDLGPVEAIDLGTASVIGEDVLVLPPLGTFLGRINLTRSGSVEAW
ncbi:MAG: DUF3459 domain-containing protein, partial [Mesorhizobium sp.]